MRLIHWLRSLKSQIPAGRRQARHAAGRGRLESVDGTLDTTFGPNGTGFTYATTGEVYSLAIDPTDNRIVACGGSTVVCLTLA
jgi:hypothetical protein